MSEPMSKLIERVARAIAAQKRQLPVNDPVIDKKWASYCGQARAAIKGASAYFDSIGEKGIAILLNMEADTDQNGKRY